LGLSFVTDFLVLFAAFLANGEVLKGRRLLGCPTMIYDHDTPHLASNFESGLLHYSQQYNTNTYCLVVLPLVSSSMFFFQLCKPPIPTYLVISNYISTLNARGIVES
jgi:hypothetical protein